ncbi:HAD family hydrolase [Cognatishimia maritima]|uniref:Haloacid dehalogenase superfamily, subfamily IA, variant 3 with third motif having DD or ED/haloacid dehalogenase superfamily, subfamily IA, variant 1 with third motif having Dx(3-4)D or Dx(3-4)E n=1 Tax=Cognatishimia maritima TaxID=870908 RepID=A0A1M5IBB2_9RHOB|nr:HAD family phosphatase [Cognatishimia maritima]SHG25654.1 haloacid dehalogenase superfamily, subfamily IA, variant 3 with third motif having DD or ED/haloacid dehalogenase superfamily, subfamily IA, variant 1 with third motif having Dx(3-4)D or Dx(3-4)E [Cognatishimia maritima]
MTSYAAYLFDMDGLLLDTERLFMVPLVTLAAREGIDASAAEAFYLDLIGTSVAETSRRLETFLPPHIDVSAFEANWRLEYDALVAKHVPLRPYAKEVLDALKSQGARMALVTSTHGASARSKLTKAGIIDYFELIKAGDEVSANKPDPAPYREAAKGLGVDPKDCVAFEDSDTGTTSAIRAGCLTYQIPDLRPIGKPLPNLGQKMAQTLWEAARDLGVINPALTS